MVGVELFWDLQGKEKINYDLGSIIIGKESRTIYVKNVGKYPLQNVWLRIEPGDVIGEFNPKSFKALSIDEIAVGQTVPAVLWEPPAGSDECALKGNFIISAVEKKWD